MHTEQISDRAAQALVRVIEVVAGDVSLIDADVSLDTATAVAEAAVWLSECYDHPALMRLNMSPEGRLCHDVFMWAGARSRY